MSLAINTNAVRRVLLADGWHEVRQWEQGSSFDLDAYEYKEAEKDQKEGFHMDMIFTGTEGIVNTGATWEEETPKGFPDFPSHVIRVYCPLTSVIAVEENAG